eukprot:3892848-Amphidinium_carterae.1
MAWIEAMAGLWADSVQDTPAYSVIRVFRLVRITKIIRVLRLQVEWHSASVLLVTPQRPKGTNHMKTT